MVARRSLIEGHEALLESRVLGTYDRGVPGPLVLVIGGVHGNEPAGVLAAARVLAALERLQPSFRGRLVALVGNRGALRLNDRFFTRDLNRLWTREQLERLARQAPEDDDPEEREQRELAAALEGEIAGARRNGDVSKIVLLDLHSTSADGSPFTIMGDTLQNRRIALALPVPVILGLEETVEGTLLAYFGDRGHVAVCVEGGQNGLESTVDHLEAALWLALEAAGLVEAADVPDVEGKREVLAHTSWGLPRVLDIRYRHPIATGEVFEMRPGYTNFHLVADGELIAHSGEERERDIRTPFAGLLLMPRYQGQGNDGFFLGREIRPFWLKLSAFLRHLRLDGLLWLLPGVYPDPTQRGVLLIDPRVARWRVSEIFHLLGYRKSRRAEGFQVFVRRPDVL